MSTADWKSYQTTLPTHAQRYLVTHGVTSIYCTARRVTIASFDKTKLGNDYEWTDCANHPILYVLAWAEIPAAWEGDK